MHPSRDDLSGFVLGTLEDQVADEVADHVEHCPQCEETLRNIEAGSDTFIQTLKEPAVEFPHSSESGCRELVQVIQAIGREPSFTSSGGVAVATDQEEDLGSLGHYRLLAKLGEGGMGAVYKALHTNLDRVVAIKVLPADRLQNEDAVSRFQREMKAVGRLNHPNIVVAHDAGEVDGTHYLVMELVDGVDLSTLLRAIGPARSRSRQTLDAPTGNQTLASSATDNVGMTVADACEMIRQAAIGLQEAYEDGMVHRDIKPSNLMLSWGRTASSSKRRKQAVRGHEPIVKILDLGLALLDDQQGRRRDLTSTGQMMGTLDYMAPEQGGDSHEVDIRADIYALGATLYKLLCGQPPFAGERYDTPIKMIRALALETPASIGEKRDDLPAELVAIVDKMLAKEAGNRFSTPQEVADALAPFAQGADLGLLLQQATAEDAETPEDESKFGTHESLKSGSVETDPTIDAPVEFPLPMGQALQSSPHAPREDPKPKSAEREPEDSIESTLTMTPAAADEFETGLPTHSKADEFDQGLPTRSKGTTQGLPDAEAALGRPAVGQVARSGDLATTRSGDLATTRDLAKPRREGRWYTNRRNQIIAAGLAGIILLAAITLFVRTKHGTIVVEIDDPSISVTVNGEDILISDPTVTIDPSSKTHKQAGQPIKLIPGEHTLHISYGELEFDTDKFNLRRGDKVVLSVKLIDGQIQVAQDNEIIARKTLHLPNYLLAFDGRSSYVETPVRYDGSLPITIEARIRVPQLSRGITQIVCDTERAGISLTTDAIDLSFVVSQGAGFARASRDFKPYLENDTHVAGILEGKTIHLFLNGIHVAESRLNTAFNPSLVPLHIGANPGENLAGKLIEFFQGTIDEVRISNVARYDKDFEPLKPGERFKPDEHTLALYHFDEGQGEIAHDSSGNNHHGKIVGAKWVKFDVDAESSSETTIPQSQEFAEVETTEPISKIALVSRPGKIKGLKSWTIETRLHRGGVRDLAHSPDGSLVAVISDDDGAIRLWDAELQQLKKCLIGHTRPVVQIAWSPDGKTLAAADEANMLFFWDVESASILPRFKAHDDRINGLAWSPDGKTLGTVCNDNSIRLWNVGTGELMLTMRDTAPVYCLTWSPDGKNLVTGRSFHSTRNMTLLFWDPTTGQKRCEVQGGTIKRVAFSSNGRVLAAGEGRLITLRDPESGEVRRTIEGPAVVNDFAWSPDGTKLVVGYEYSIIKIWDTQTGEEVRTLCEKSSTEDVLSLDFALDGKMITAGFAGIQGVARRFDIASGELLNELDGHPQRLSDVDLSPAANQLAVGAGIQGLYEWRTSADGPSRHHSRPHDVSCTRWSPDGNLLATAWSDGVVRLWKANARGELSGTPVEIGVGYWIRGLAWYGDSRKLAVTTDAGKDIAVIDTDTGEQVVSMKGGSYMYWPAWSPDGHKLAAVRTHFIEVFDLDKEELTQTIPGVYLPLDAQPCWSPSGECLAFISGDRKKVVIWNIAKQMLDEELSHEVEVTAVIWLPDENIVTVAADRKVRFWDMATGKITRNFEGPSLGRFLVNRNLLVESTRSAFRFWDLKTGEPGATRLLLKNDWWLTIQPNGYHQGHAQVESEIVYVVQTEAGQETLTPDEFTKKYGWKNDPEKVKLTD